MKSKLSTQSYKGARDFYPDEMRTRNYIFATWKKVCAGYGFEEYDFPILEPLEIFSAKSGEELVNDQLFSFEDRGGRKIAVRPELTPGTVRLIAQRFGELTKPLKWFMIGNNWRYEKPQMGRGREFYQLEANIFGVAGVTADFEIFQLIISLMEAFGANEEQFEILVNDRRLVVALLKQVLSLDDDTAEKVRKIMDKRSKMDKQRFVEILEEYGLNKANAVLVDSFMTSSFDNLSQVVPQTVLNANLGYLNIKRLFEMLEEAKLAKYCKFSPSIIRGFDYSDGLVYEVFDKNPANKRSMFGGERFDKLIEIFGDYELPATGFAMGDWTLLEFLRNWNLLPNLEPSIDYLVTVWPSEEDSTYFACSAQIASVYRKLGKKTFLWPDTNTKLDKQLKYADKKGAQNVVIVGDEEIKNKQVTIKNLSNGTQTTISIDSIK